MDSRAWRSRDFEHGYRNAPGLTHQHFAKHSVDATPKPCRLGSLNSIRVLDGDVHEGKIGVPQRVG